MNTRLKIIELKKHPRIHVALAAGISIIFMAWFSKRVLPEPISKSIQAIPPLLMTLYELFLDKYKENKLFKSKYWILAILGATILIIGLHWI